MNLTIFDLDGTLTEDYLRREGKGFVPIEGRSFTKPNLRENVKEIISQLEGPFAIVTNQAGPAFGHCTTEDCHARINHAISQAFSEPVPVYVCFGHLRATNPVHRLGWERRKPSPAMINEAMRDHNIEPKDTIFIGDLPTDRLAARNAGVSYFDAKRFFGATEPLYGVLAHG